MHSKIEEVKQHLEQSFNWDRSCAQNINFVHRGWIMRDLEANTPLEAARIHHERCKQLARSVSAEFKDKHSSMSQSAAAAYAKHWN